ncbi:MAG TPA: hypothetical protein VNQ76_15500 [Planctomicrobium sp.]|nr:hypothetical protein [Planctomicrobium sp.]
MLRYVLCCIALGTTFLHGCGQAGDVDLGVVTGVVTLDNKPLKDALISFTPDQGGRPSFGITGGDGRYVLDYSSKRRGALIGRHAVHISTVLEGPSEAGKGEPVTPLVEEKVPEKYRTKEGTVVVVESGRNQIDFALKND